MQYLGETFNTWPKDDYESAFCMEIICGASDYLGPMD